VHPPREQEPLGAHHEGEGLVDSSVHPTRSRPLAQDFRPPCGASPASGDRPALPREKKQTQRLIPSPPPLHQPTHSAHHGETDRWTSPPFPMTRCSRLRTTRAPNFRNPFGPSAAASLASAPYSASSGPLGFSAAGNVADAIPIARTLFLNNAQGSPPQPPGYRTAGQNRTFADGQYGPFTVDSGRKPEIRQQRYCPAGRPVPTAAAFPSALGFRPARRRSRFASTGLYAGALRKHQTRTLKLNYLSADLRRSRL